MREYWAQQAEEDKRKSEALAAGLNPPPCNQASDGGASLKQQVLAPRTLSDLHQQRAILEAKAGRLKERIVILTDLIRLWSED